MTETNREDRLWQEVKELRQLRKQSTIFDFEFQGEPPDQFIVSFHGKGLQKPDSKSAGNSSVVDSSDTPAVDEEFLENHQVQIQMAYLYPEREPDIKWLTPIFHPNLSNSGFVEMEDIGLTWDKNLTMGVICERLWDMIRLAHLDLENASDFAARDWFRNECSFKLPLDARPLRDKLVATQSNIVQYRRRNKKESRRRMAIAERDVLFIGAEGQASVESPKEPGKQGEIESRNSEVPEPVQSNSQDVESVKSQPTKGDDEIMFIE